MKFMYDRRENDLKSYFPDYVKEFVEFDSIAKLEAKELKVLCDGCQDLWDAGFILTADYQGIKKWELFLDLKPEPQFTLDERRSAVLANWNYQLPYSKSKLGEQLTALLGEDYELYIFHHIYKLKLVVKERPITVLKSIQGMIREMIPANLETFFLSKYQENYNIQTSCKNSIRYWTGFYPRYNLPHLYLDNQWLLDGSRRLNGYNSGEFIDFYPIRSRFGVNVPEFVQATERIKVPMVTVERITTGNNILRFRTDLRGDIQCKEKVAFASETEEQVTAGPTRVMNVNVVNNTWKLDSRRKLNGGLSIL